MKKKKTLTLKKKPYFLFYNQENTPSDMLSVILKVP